MIKKSLLAFFITAALTPATVAADEQQDVKAQLELLKAQIARLEARLAQQEAATADAKTVTVVEEVEIAATEPAEKKADGIRVGGAIRTNFSHTSYSDGNKNRGGDFDFDIFRLNLHGSVGDVTLDAEIRFFDYMTAIKYAYVGYQLSENWQTQAGIIQVPFGNWPYNSHNYFFSTNYYLGLEDDFDLGILFKRQIADNWQLDVGFFKNDELGGVDGYVEDRADRYSYDIVGGRVGNEGIYADPSYAIGEYNTLSGRFAYHTEFAGVKTELGISALAGGLHDGRQRAGDYNAFGLHLNSHYGRWNLQLQHTEYNYNLDDTTRIAVGAYAFYDSIAAEAKSITANIAYSLPVQWGPVTGLQFYNNYGLVYDKSDGTADTMMNVAGFSVAAGGLFTYFDLVHARNQPFVGGSAAGNSDDTERRFNINIGYYF
ncbi:carbohydrate porin [Alishewanella sp. 16-MA]|uniref:Carbohydrate porin n=1 Tax=Alishewanella maricola TaxID=2795740 RepID=A0ABS8C6S6_9ALTE|nr:FlxA-like family protein [Alishewanella maricola]MCB5228040.1 carbohydrate porin [Alishewanella maricola]